MVDCIGLSDHKNLLISKIHKELAALSTKGKQRVVPGASHTIQADKPDSVAKAVLEVLGQIK